MYFWNGMVMFRKYGVRFKSLDYLMFFEDVDKNYSHYWLSKVIIPMNHLIQCISGFKSKKSPLMKTEKWHFGGVFQRWKLCFLQMKSRLTPRCLGHHIQGLLIQGWKDWSETWWFPTPESALLGSNEDEGVSALLIRLVVCGLFYFIFSSLTLSLL